MYISIYWKNSELCKKKKKKKKKKIYCKALMMYSRFLNGVYVCIYIYIYIYIWDGNYLFICIYVYIYLEKLNNFFPYIKQHRCVLDLQIVRYKFICVCRDKYVYLYMR